jgi:hypothetical protein
MAKKFFHDANWTTPLLAAQTTISATPKIHLFTGNPILTGTNVPGDFTEANYTGYAAQTLVIGTTVVRQVDGQLVVLGTTAALFKATGSAVGNTVTGYFVTDMGGANVLWAEKFDTPFVFVDANSFLALTLYLGLNGLGGTDDAVGT